MGTNKKDKLDILSIGKDMNIKGVNVDEAIIALAQSGVSQADLEKLKAITRAAAELNSLPVVAVADFTETAGAGTYTAEVTIPAGAFVLDVMWVNSALWTAATSAAMNVGDTTDPDGIFAAVNVKAAPALGAFLSYQRKDAGVGAYAGTKLLQYAAQDKIKATVTTEGAAGVAGRSRMIVTFVNPPAPVVAAKA
jgi:hypothetical protein